MNDITLTITGNVVTDVALRFTKSGEPVASFRMAAGTRRFDRSSDAWVDGDTHFFDVSCWRNLGQNVIESISKGMPIIVVGRLRSREVHKECGDHVHSVTYRDLDAVSVGADLTRGISSFTRVKRDSVVEAEQRASSEVYAHARLTAAANAAGASVGPSSDEDDDELVDAETGEILARV